MTQGKTIYCAQCGSPHPDKYEAGLCCDVKLEGESDEDQLRRLFSDEIAADAKEAADVVYDKLITPTPAEELAKHFKLGSHVETDIEAWYAGKKLEVFAIQHYGISCVEHNESHANWAPRILTLSWQIVDLALKAKRIIIHEPRKTYRLRKDLRFFLDNLKRIEVETGVEQSLNVYA